MKFATAFVFVATMVCLSIADVSAVGCGGFVRQSQLLAQTNSGQLDYSQVKVVLLTPEGREKGSSYCDPVGYYFIPMYDSSAYTVVAVGPAGWQFSPERFALQAHHNTEEDVNFELTGFAYRGKLASSCGGPVANVRVKLARDGFERSSETAQDGSFAFSDMLPGTYSLTVSRPGWSFSKAQQSVVIEWGGSELREAIQVSGYPVSARIAGSTDLPAPDITLFLYQPAGAAAPSTCTPAVDAPAREGQVAHCQSTSDESGDASFHGVACGSYTLVPQSARGRAAFDVTPVSTQVSVAGPTDAGTFIVAHFAATGVVNDHKGAPLAGVSVLVNGQVRATSDGSGEYRLEALQPGTYRLTASMPHVYFTEVSAPVAPGTAALPAIAVGQYDVCGRLELDSSQARKTKITATAQDGTVIPAVFANSAGEYCIKLAPGEYTLRTETPAGVFLSPVSRTVSVNGYVSSVDFMPARVSVSGNVKCIGPIGHPGQCDDQVLVVLSGPRDFKTSADANGNFVFAGVAPGTYSVTASHPGWCWESSSEKKWADALTVTNIAVAADKDVTGLSLSQLGFTLVIDVSHETKATLQNLDSGKPASEEQLVRGENTLCLRTPGVRAIVPRGCVKFDHDEYRFDTTKPAPVKLQATAFQVKGFVDASIAHSNMRVNVINARTDAVVTTTLTAVTQERYSYSFWAERDVQYVIRPEADGNALCYPATQTVTLSTAGCPADLPAFTMRAGTYYSGSVSPPVAGVRVVVSSKSGEQVGEASTDASGEYSVGPLRDDREYRMVASKDGYQITPLAGHNFRAVQLTGVEISVVDSDGAPVTGVHVSVTSAGGYVNKKEEDRFTSATGVLTLSNLRPGSYYVRPQLKEYSFEPATMTADLSEGVPATARFVAKRNAFSVFGVVRRLDGTPVAGAVVEAFSETLHEDARTNSDGSYRIRGLLPGSAYEVRIDLDKSNLQRASPSKQNIPVVRGDTRDINFIVFPHPQTHRLRGRVITPMQWREFIVIDVAEPGVGVTSVPLGPAGIFEIPQLRSGRYQLSVRVTNALRSFDTQLSLVAPEGVAVAGNGVSIELPAQNDLVLEFAVRARDAHQEITRAPFFVLLFAVALAAAAWQHSLVGEWIQRALATYRGLSAKRTPAPQANSAVEKTGKNSRKQR
eukprot:TRINITY_DN1512_c1_g1_i1.p1 TRINITY_DN1512_c1_g1~~TRINITY_DN1512_c1_g1_i1.p1  ORF type:complete len:1156 (+),score=295.52 TRINITY_DN1512_c1_g1_i1:71-3538(+)